MGSRNLIEGWDFKRYEEFHQCLSVSLRIAALRCSILQLTDGNGRNGNVIGTELLQLLDNGRRMILDNVNANVRIQHEEHYDHSSLVSTGG
jgi:hypothetical protein